MYMHACCICACVCIYTGLCVLTQNPVPALQLVRVFALAEVVNEVSQLFHILQALSHHHLLMDQVGLGQVGTSLGEKEGYNIE